METYLALLRGINVGGKHKVAMAELKSMFLESGMLTPLTVLQSGNVVFQSTESHVPTIESLLSDRFEQLWGFDCKFHVRRSGELERIIDDNPFKEQASSDPSHLVAIFLKESIPLESVAEVASRIQGREKIAAANGVLYAWYPDGIGTSTIDRTPGWSRLTKDGTARNWNTLLKMRALCESFR